MQRPHSGSSLSHRLFCVLHRKQAFFEIDGRRLVLMLEDGPVRTSEPAEKSEIDAFKDDVQKLREGGIQHLNDAGCKM